MAIGAAPRTVLEEFAHVAGAPMSAPAGDFRDLPPAGALLACDTNQLRSSETVPAKSEHSRHKRKYAHGELESERSFYFTGPHGQFKLRAQNLTIFLRLAEGLDDETWQYHRQCGDYSAWFREAMRDNDLANEAGQIEKNRA